jgi:hypothetical protein
LHDKAKPVEKQGRKATILNDSRVATREFRFLILGNEVKSGANKWLKKAYSSFYCFWPLQW